MVLYYNNTPCNEDNDNDNDSKSLQASTAASKVTTLQTFLYFRTAGLNAISPMFILTRRVLHATNANMWPTTEYNAHEWSRITSAIFRPAFNWQSHRNGFDKAPRSSSQSSNFSVSLRSLCGAVGVKTLHLMGSQESHWSEAWADFPNRISSTTSHHLNQTTTGITEKI